MSHYTAIALLFSLCVPVFPIINSSGSRESFLCIENYYTGHHKLCSSQKCGNVSYLSTLPTALKENQRPYYIQFCSTNIVLEERVEFQHLHNVSFIGYHGTTTINCTNQAGMSFIDSKIIHLENVILDHCGAIHSSTSTSNKSTLHFHSSMYLLNVTNFSMRNVAIRNSNGLGLVLFDVDGLVAISSCVFQNNTATLNHGDNAPAGGGVYVEFTYCPPGTYDDNCVWHNSTKHSRYNISDSKFANNNASSIKKGRAQFHVNNRARFMGFGRGGGLQVTFRGHSTGNSMTIYNCTFYHNTAEWGGGLKASFQDESQNNSLFVIKSKFHKNTCLANGGGGANIGYTYYQQPFPQNNKISFSNCDFIENEAKFGGGIAFYSSDSTSSLLNNSIEFTSCTWVANKARFGSAISMSIQAWTTYLSGNLPTPTFTNTTFINNYIIDQLYCSKEGIYKTYGNGTGTFFATRYTLLFNNSLEFRNNNGSAMYLTSSIMKVAPNTTVTFINNSGFNGGAIALIAFSVIVLADNSSLTFQHNKAVRCGGAIYSYSIDKHDYLSSRSCFLQNNHSVTGMAYNVSVTFLNNDILQQTNISRSYCGRSIYAVTLKPCLYFCKQNNMDEMIPMEDVFKCVGNVTFNDGKVRDYELSTSGARFAYNMSMTIFSMIPSKEDFLPVSLIDDLNQIVHAEYHLTIVNHENSEIKADEAYTYLSQNRTELYGKPENAANILLSQTGFRGHTISFSLHMEHCPPGYVLFNDDQFNLNLSRCKCSVGTNQSYRGIHQCDDNDFIASIQHGYWIGYVENETEEGLLCGYCPDRYCFKKDEQTRLHRLIGHASREELDQRVCNDTRTGVLCGQCRDGYSVLYHSSSSLCHNSSNCEFGWLLYFASELIPLTLMFTIIVIFNISFVSGELNGFIFFAQVFDLLSITGNGFIWFPKPAYSALVIIRSIYKFLNFDFFIVNELSFCLWKGASTLDTIIFKYVTVLYALLLIVLTVWLMNKCNVYKRLSCLRVSTVKSSVIHGISAFLVMVYTQCAKVSFKLLDFTVIYSKGHVYNHVVATYQGNIKYFEPNHLPYAIPAIVSIIVVIVTPIVILTLYPSVFKVTSFFKLEEKICISCIVQRLPHAYLKPFTDSFQSCFKDNMRFFAGFYFVYRVVILIGWFAPTHLTQSYMFLELILITILVIHAIAQPYISRKHNILDALLFFNLAVINGITVYNYHYAKYYRYKGYEFITIQLVLVYIPLICFIFYASINFINKVKKIYNSQKLKTLALIQLRELMAESENELPSRLNENCEEEAFERTDEANYKLFAEPNSY